MSEVIRKLVRRALARMGYEILRMPPGPQGLGEIPDADCYHPFFTPWLRDPEFNDVYDTIASKTIVSIDRCHVLWTLGVQALHHDGDFIECGVYQGGTAKLLVELVDRWGGDRHVHLFDTFSGMPQVGEVDLHKRGDFADTSLIHVSALIGKSEIAAYYPGYIPDTFSGLENVTVAFAHVDVDLFQTVLDCCDFVYPRLVSGGVMVFDDYGFASCPGARKAVDVFFLDKPERPLVLSNGQAIVVKCW